MKQVKHKFHAVKSECDGIRFSSKLEKRWYSVIKDMKDSGELLFFLRQVPFHIAPDVTYRADFMLFYTDGNVEVWECKGYDTPEWKIKKKMVENIFPIEIKVVK